MSYHYAPFVTIAIFVIVFIGLFSDDSLSSNLYGFDNVSSRGNLIDNLSTNTSLRVILLGDIGGLPVYPYYTYAQTKVANAITDIAIQKKPHFVLNLGDNFYFTGVSNEYDKRFESSFENIYDTDALQVPWYTVAGNHDHFGNVSAQVAYTKYSKKWNFPSVYYNLSFHINQTTVDILMIDTVILCGNTADVENGDLFDLLWNKSHDPEGPDDIEQAEKQWKWIEYHLNASSADYLFVAGHYPIHSISSHGPTKCLIERLDPLLKQYSVSAYFAGHDHTLQHIIYPGEGMHLIHYVVSGVASRSDRSKKHLNTVAVENLKFHYPSSWNPFSQLGFSNGGFVYMDINKQRAELFFLNGKGAEKYRTSIVPRSIDSPHFIAF